MKKYLIALSALALMTFCGCSEGDLITQNFDIDGSYTELVVEDAFDVTISNDVTQAVVTAGDNIMSKVRLEKSGNTLNIRLKGWVPNSGDPKVILPYNPNMTSVNLSGASELHSPFTLNGQTIEIKCSGSSDFFGSIDANELKLKLSGSSDATIDGTVTKANLNISGSSDLEKKIVSNRYSLTCDQCECSISGSSEAYVHCDGKITGSISGSSRLYFTGTAFSADCSTSGSSKIIHEVL